MAAKDISLLELEKASKLAHVPKCDEYDKMISGMMLVTTYLFIATVSMLITFNFRYDSFVPELNAGRLEGRKFMNKYNNWFPEGADITVERLTEKRTEMLRQHLGHVGDDEVYIEPPFRVDYGPNISLGKRFYAGFGLTILDCAIVTIGDRVMFGPNVLISTATHETDVESRRANIEYARPITIGNDCWIGGGVIILPGVKIGHGCTIGAGATVTRDIPDWSVAVGCPAKVIKKVKELSFAEE